METAIVTALRPDAPAPAASPIRVGNYLSAALSPFYQGVADYLSQRLGTPTTLVTGSSLGAFAAGEVDVGFV